MLTASPPQLTAAIAKEGVQADGKGGKVAVGGDRRGADYLDLPGISWIFQNQARDYLCGHHSHEGAYTLHTYMFHIDATSWYGLKLKAFHVPKFFKFLGVGRPWKASALFELAFPVMIGKYSAG